MTEKKLQAVCVMDFSQTHPERKGNLWSTRNTTFSERDGQTQKAMGMIAGVSDLIYFHNKRFVGIELKMQGSTHNTKHVSQQIKWGEKIIEAGGEYYIVTTLDEFWTVINGGQTQYTVEKVKEMINESKTKIKF